jgi:hypothetical protein
MKINFGRQEAFLIVITFIFFAAFNALDNWLNQLRLEGASNFDPAPFIWLATAANIFLVGSLLFLAWYTLRKKRIHFIVALLFIGVGTIIASNPVMVFVYGVSYLPSVPVVTYGPISLFTTGGAFLLVLGLLMLVSNRRR